MSRDPIFLVEDQADTAALFVRWLENEGYPVEHFGDAEECMAALSRYVPALICLDLELPGMSGLEALERVRSRHSRLPVLMLTANRDVDNVVSAMRHGAHDYLTKPVEKTRLLTSVGNALEHSRMERRLRVLERRISRETEWEGMVGGSAAMHALFDELERVSDSDVTVLIQGESGTGKELVARAIHARSGRGTGPFVAVNCAAIPDNLIESELFGHEKGAFTGADARRTGRFEEANGGTLFLDEIAELALPMQAKLLRVLQERRVRRVGGTRDVALDFRLVAATHQDLFERAQDGAFREDLFYRVAVFELEVPALRDRRGDLPLLCDALLDRIAPERSLRMSEDALVALASHDFPGNVRELENALRRAAVLARDDVIAPRDLPRRVRQGRDASGPAAAPAEVPVERRGRMEDIEREALRAALERTGGNIAEVVRELGIGRTTVYRKLKKYGLR